MTGSKSSTATVITFGVPYEYYNGANSNTDLRSDIALMNATTGQIYEAIHQLHYDKYGQYENDQWIESKQCVRGELKEDTIAKLYLWAQEL